MLWVCPFVFRARQQRKMPSVTAPAARWGVGLHMVAFFIACFPIVRSRPPGLLSVDVDHADFGLACVEGREAPWEAVADSSRSLFGPRTGPERPVRRAASSDLRL